MLWTLPDFILDSLTAYKWNGSGTWRKWPGQPFYPCISSRHRPPQFSSHKTAHFCRRIWQALKVIASVFALIWIIWFINDHCYNWVYIIGLEWRVCPVWPPYLYDMLAFCCSFPPRVGINMWWSTNHLLGCKWQAAVRRHNRPLERASVARSFCTASCTRKKNLGYIFPL